MSNQPSRTLGRESVYRQQWPPSRNASIPTNDHPHIEHNTAPPLPATMHGQPLEYHTTGLNASSQVPGYSGQAPFLPLPLPYMGQVGTSQMPYQFPPAGTPGFGLQPMAPAEPSNPPAALNPRAGDFSQPSISQRREDCVSREEGEVSEGGRSLESKQDWMSATCRLPRTSITRNSDLEEGETVSNKSQSSSQSSSRMYTSGHVSLSVFPLTSCSLQSTLVSICRCRSGQSRNPAAEARSIHDPLGRIATFEDTGSTSTSNARRFA